MNLWALKILHALIFVLCFIKLIRTFNVQPLILMLRPLINTLSNLKKIWNRKSKYGNSNYINLNSRYLAQTQICKSKIATNKILFIHDRISGLTWGFILSPVIDLESPLLKQNLSHMFAARFTSPLESFSPGQLLRTPDFVSRSLR